MAYDVRKSKYLRNSNQKKDEEKKDESKSEKKEFRSSVITPKRARELAMQQENGAEQIAKSEPEVKEEQDENAETEKHEYRKSVITPKRAKELALEAEKAADENQPEPEPEHEERVRNKGTSTDIFRGEVNEAEQERLYEMESAKKSTKNVRSNAIVRMLVSTVVLTVIAAVLAAVPYLKIHIPYTPEILTVDFSVLPEFIATIAYGPLFGVIICVIKNLILILVNTNNLITAVNNILLDSVFLLITGYMYAFLMYRRDKNAYKKNKIFARPYDGKRVILSSVVGALVSLIPQFFITRYVAYPLIEKFFGAESGYTLEWFAASYSSSMVALKEKLPEAISRILPDVNGLMKGIAVFNLPVTFVKLLLISVAAAIILRFTLPFLHYRDKEAKKSVSIEKD